MWTARDVGEITAFLLALGFSALVLTELSNRLQNRIIARLPAEQRKR